MSTPSALRRPLIVYLAVCVAVFAATRLEPLPVIGQYVHLIVAAIFLLTAVRLARGRIQHYGLSLGGLLVPPTDDEPRGPFGLWDLGRALVAALPSAVRELGVAAVVGIVVFALYTVGFWWWNQPTRAFALTWPPEVGALILAQLVIVSLPEEAFFRGYLQTALSDAESRRVRVLGVELAPVAWVAQAILFSLVHLFSEPHPARLAVVFPALLFGWVRVWRRGIGAAIALHAMSNLYSEILSRSWL